LEGLPDITQFGVDRNEHSQKQSCEIAFLSAGGASGIVNLHDDARARLAFAVVRPANYGAVRATLLEAEQLRDALTKLCVHKQVDANFIPVHMYSDDEARPTKGRYADMFRAAPSSSVGDSPTEYVAIPSVRVVLLFFADQPGEADAVLDALLEAAAAASTAGRGGEAGAPFARFRRFFENLKL